MKRAVYAGSFDPPTKGHLWVIEQASKLFDEVVVVTGFNAEKKELFSVEERTQMLVDMVGHLSNVSVTSVGNEYVARYASSVGAQFLVRGIRNATDFEYERTMRMVNGDLEPAVLEVFFIPPRELVEASSSAVKALIGPPGWEKVVSYLVSPRVLYRLMAKHCSLWRDLLAAGASGDEDEFWEAVLWPYFDPSRYYHNEAHFAQVMREWGRVKHLLADPLAVQLALAVHDSVYDPHCKNNEEQSAELARAVARKIGMSVEFADRVYALVLCTKHQVVPTDGDAKLLCDIDLSILGAPEPEFEAYDRGIAREYAWADAEVFRSRRRAILWGLLLRHEQVGVFLTAEFRGWYENRVKKNLERAYHRLES